MGQVLAVGGPFNSGKTVFLDGLFQKLYDYTGKNVARCQICPDEGFKLNFPRELRDADGEGDFTDTFVSQQIGIVKNLKTTRQLVLIDLGGMITDENRIILSETCAENMIVVSRDENETHAWEQFSADNGVPVYAKFQTYLGAGVPTIDFDSDPIEGELYDLVVESNGGTTAIERNDEVLTALAKRIVGDFELREKPESCSSYIRYINGYAVFEVCDDIRGVNPREVYSILKGVEVPEDAGTVILAGSGYIWSLGMKVNLLSHENIGICLGAYDNGDFESGILMLRGEDAGHFLSESTDDKFNAAETGNYPDVSVSETSDYQSLNFRIPGDKLITPRKAFEIDFTDGVDVDKGVVISGRGPGFLYIYANEQLKTAGVPFIGFYNPKFDGAICVYSAAEEMEVGDIISYSPLE